MNYSNTIAEKIPRVVPAHVVIILTLGACLMAIAALSWQAQSLQEGLYQFGSSILNGIKAFIMDPKLIGPTIGFAFGVGVVVVLLPRLSNCVGNRVERAEITELLDPPKADATIIAGSSVRHSSSVTSEPALARLPMVNQEKTASVLQPLKLEVSESSSSAHHDLMVEEVIPVLAPLLIVAASQSCSTSLPTFPAQESIVETPIDYSQNYFLPLASEAGDLIADGLGLRDHLKKKRRSSSFSLGSKPSFSEVEVAPTFLPPEKEVLLPDLFSEKECEKLKVSQNKAQNEGRKRRITDEERVELKKLQEMNLTLVRTQERAVKRRERMEKLSRLIELGTLADSGKEVVRIELVGDEYLNEFRIRLVGQALPQQQRLGFSSAIC